MAAILYITVKVTPPRGLSYGRMVRDRFGLLQIDSQSARKDLHSLLLTVTEAKSPGSSGSPTYSERAIRSSITFFHVIQIVAVTDAVDHVGAPQALSVVHRSTFRFFRFDPKSEKLYFLCSGRFSYQLHCILHTPQKLSKVSFTAV